MLDDESFSLQVVDELALDGFDSVRQALFFDRRGVAQEAEVDGRVYRVQTIDRGDAFVVVVSVSL